MIREEFEQFGQFWDLKGETWSWDKGANFSLSRAKFQTTRQHHLLCSGDGKDDCVFSKHSEDKGCFLVPEGRHMRKVEMTDLSERLPYKGCCERWGGGSGPKSLSSSSRGLSPQYLPTELLVSEPWLSRPLKNYLEGGRQGGKQREPWLWSNLRQGRNMALVSWGYA